VFRLSLAAALLAVPCLAADPPAWWSLQPPKPSAGAKSVDHFLRAKRSDSGLSLAPLADRRALVRRVTFDLTGLPPTPDEVAAFEKDAAPDAYEKLVERLLASPGYGERMARMWMDVVHFAETHGHDQDRVRPNAWRYRDYLIRSFNADTPYARFVREQIAADVLFPDEPHLTAALGFLAAGPWDESSLRDIRDDSIDRQIGYYLDRDDIVTTVMSTFQGLTVQCARCHDHKFDPISQADYYRLQAVFAGVGRGDVSFDADASTRAKRAELTASLGAGGFAHRLRGWVALSHLPAPMSVYAAAPSFAPDAGHKPVAAPRPVHMLKRGDIRRPAEKVEPGTVAGLPFALKDATEGERRAALARSITDAANPLTYRVMANRIWQQHFGRGLVDTPNDFGKMGQQPAHPELLDWLAEDLREHQALKRLHRLIVTSDAYRRSSRHDMKAAALDADNKLLWRMPRTRLDAEQTRDAILQISGRLDRTTGGPSDRQFLLLPGIHVTPQVIYTAFNWDRPQGHRRSVYRFVFRTLPDPLVDCLDGADASQLTAKRTESVTAPQALALLNNEFVLVHAKAFAARLEKHSPKRAEQIDFACRLVWGRAPTAEEAKAFAAHAEAHGLPNLCRVLFNSNEFLFLD
jgi:hypothetical protein